jgi:hypothetical protein
VGDNGTVIDVDPPLVGVPFPVNDVVAVGALFVVVLRRSENVNELVAE